MHKTDTEPKPWPKNWGTDSMNYSFGPSLVEEGIYPRIPLQLLDFLAVVYILNN